MLCDDGHRRSHRSKVPKWLVVTVVGGGSMLNERARRGWHGHWFICMDATDGGTGMARAQITSMDYTTCERRLGGELHLQRDIHRLLLVMGRNWCAHGCELKVMGKMSFVWIRKCKSCCWKCPPLGWEAGYHGRLWTNIANHVYIVIGLWEHCFCDWLIQCFCTKSS